jgi:PAS domain S-box-containing protein
MEANVNVYRSELKHHALIHSLPIGIFQVGAQGECSYVNKRWCEITGLEAEKALGTGWIRALHPEDRERILEEWRTAAQQGQLFKSVYRFLACDGRAIWVYGQIAEERSEAGEILGYVGMITDISDQKQFEQRLLLQSQDELCHAQRLIMIGELVGIMVHELNQPIGAIANYLEGAAIRYQKELKSYPELAETIDHVKNLTEHAIHAIRNIRALTRRQDLSPQRVDINALIRGTVRLIAAEVARRRIKTTLHLASSIPPIRGNRTHLQQVLLNLILNGMDAMETIDARNRRLSIRTAHLDHVIEIHITDTGIGFGEELAARLFEPFMTTKDEGVGLGLSMCRTIVELHGGEILADSRPGEGATFRVILPIHREGKS